MTNKPNLSEAANGKLKLSAKAKIEIQTWRNSISDKERRYWDSFEKQTRSSVPLIEAVEIFGEDAIPVLEEKLKDLSEQEEKFQNLLEAKVAAAQRKFKNADEFSKWFFTQVLTLKTSTKLAKIKEENPKINQALFLLTKGPNKSWEAKVESARQIPVESLVPAKLRKAGSKRLVGSCPLHDDSTPSFTVYLASNSWYCFGCLKGGNPIDLKMELGHIDFAEAVRRLT